jgi:hypothetical protein
MFVLCKGKDFVFSDILDASVDDCQKVLDEIFNSAHDDPDGDNQDIESDGDYFEADGADDEEDGDDGDSCIKNPEKDDDDASIVEMFTEDLTAGDLFLDAPHGGFRADSRLDYEKYTYPIDLQERAVLPSSSGSHQQQ